MSMKTMTTKQLRGDLELLARTWPGGVPPEQADRVNAIKGELKRRGEETAARAPGVETKPRGSLADMTDDQLATELQALSASISNDPKDDGAQERFADVRFEMRRRSKDEVKKAAAVPRDLDLSGVPPMPASSVEAGPASTPTTVRTYDEARKAYEKSDEAARRSPLVPVKGFSADVGGRGVVLKYTAKDHYDNIVQVASSMFVDDAEALIAMIRDAIDRARNLS